MISMGFSDWFKDLRKSIMILHLIHISGLPLPENSKCKLTLYVDKLQFKDDSTTIELEKSRVTNVELRKFSKQESQIESSFLKTVAGAALFGAAGAIIGAMPEQKITKKEFTNLVIEYWNHENKTAMIVLDTTQKIKYGQQLIDEFKQEHQEKISEPVIL